MIDPRGVVPLPLATLEGGLKEAPLIDGVELGTESGVCVNARPSSCDAVDETELGFFCEEDSREGDLADDTVSVVDDLRSESPGSESATIFTPVEEPDEAGMNSVVTPFFLRTVRSGWLAEQQPVS